jgi:hypothetical protein
VFDVFWSNYEAQSDEEAVAEDEAAYEATTHTAMEVPVELALDVFFCRAMPMNVR